MIKEIKIKNFKSIKKTRFPLGRVNLVVGSNGSGKTNLLEAIAVCSAAYQGSVDTNHLVRRGVRIPDRVEHFASLFPSDEDEESDVPVRFQVDCKMSSGDTENQTHKEWQWFVKSDPPTLVELPEDSFLRGDLDRLSDYIVFKPEESVLRKLSESGDDGIKSNGSGFLSHLRAIRESNDKREDLIRLIGLVGWLDVTINDVNESSQLYFRDRYISPQWKWDADFSTMEDCNYDPVKQGMNQNSVDTGTLFLLFYATLILGDNTPNFFAIENVDKGINPKLARRLIREICELSEKYDKQIVVTVHNPSSLNGINTDDDSCRLFSVWKNVCGHTHMQRIKKQRRTEGMKPVKLSEAFMRGYLGGLPKNF